MPIRAARTAKKGIQLKHIGWIRHEPFTAVDMIPDTRAGFASLDRLIQIKAELIVHAGVKP